MTDATNGVSAPPLDLGPLQAWQNAELLLPGYQNLPRGLFVTLVLVRETQSEAVFRTEGTGEAMCTEIVPAGLQGDGVVQRVVITKRKQTAVERRAGREIVRAVDPQLMTRPAEAGEPLVCMLNTNAPCERCIDCWLYGYAVGGGGAQRSRVLTEDAFTVLPAEQVIATRTFNATFDDGTMRHPVDKTPSTALSESEYVRPGVHFIDVEVLKDVTALEALYVLGNIARSTRYGAISSRIGRMDNHLLAIGLGRAEGPSALELVRSVHDVLCSRPATPAHPLQRDLVLATVKAQAEARLKATPGVTRLATDDELTRLAATVKRYLEAPAACVRALHAGYPTPQSAPPRRGRRRDTSA